MGAFFSFLHRRTDFYLVPHEDDLKEGKAKMGFKLGDAEKLLLASFRQFPLRRMPRQKEVPNQLTDNPTKEIQSSTKTNDKAPSISSQTPTIDKGENDVRLTKDGLQIPVGNGGTTKRYKWTQNLEECTVLVSIPSYLRGKDLSIEMKSKSLSVKSKKPLDGDSEPKTYVEGPLSQAIVPDESTWTLEGGVIIMTLFKKTKTFWSTVVEGDEEIDASLVDSRRHIGDYDTATQAQIRKIIHEQNQEKQKIPPEQLAQAKPLSAENIPKGSEFIDGKKMAEISKK